MLLGGAIRDQALLLLVVVLARAKFASLAQLVEHSLDKGKVVGSGPTRSIGIARIAQR